VTWTTTFPCRFPDSTARCASATVTGQQRPQREHMFQRTLRREEDQLRKVQLCPIYHGDPGYVLERAQADDAAR
jgi:hypothetical protein